MDEINDNLIEVPKSLRFLHIQHNSDHGSKNCDDNTQSKSVCQVLPNLKLLSSVSNNDRILQFNASEQISDERSVQTYDIRCTNPNEIFGNFGEKRLSKSLPELKDLDYLSTFFVQDNKETESLTDSESLLSEDIIPNWKSKVDFLLTGITFSLGLNNIWR